MARAMRKKTTTCLRARPMKKAPKIERTYAEKQYKLYRGIHYRKVCIAENDAKIAELPDGPEKGAMVAANAKHAQVKQDLEYVRAENQIARGKEKISENKYEGTATASSSIGVEGVA